MLSYILVCKNTRGKLVKEVWELCHGNEEDVQSVFCCWTQPRYNRSVARPRQCPAPAHVPVVPRPFCALSSTVSPFPECRSEPPRERGSSRCRSP